MSLRRTIELLAAAPDEPSRLHLMERLSDVLESAISRSATSPLGTGALQYLAQILAPLALEKHSAETREAALHLLVNVSLLAAMQHQPVDVKPIADHIAQFNESESEYALHILGQSQHREYLPIIDRYRQHQNPTLREVAHQAYVELSGEKGAKGNGEVVH